jgi:4-amino-4-deoxy-L-arabinose transferase-like glycosyltransferase
MNRIFNKTNTLAFMAAITLWRAFVNATLELHPDEAYYWLWSKHLALSYYDHPGMVAYLIKLSTLVSSSPFFVRLPGLAAAVILSWLLWKLAVQMFNDEAAASASVITLNVLPLMMSGTIIITPDAPAILFWGFAVYAAWQVSRTGAARWWYITALWLGLSLLSKYTSILFVPCLFLFILLTDERKWLKTPHPYAALALSLAFFLPVVFWNMSHGWISFKFQLGHGMGGNKYNFGTLVEYVGGQLLVAGPLGWLAGVTAALALLFSRDKAKLFLSLMSLPVILFFAYTSLKKAAGPNWPAPAYFTMALIIPVFWMYGSRVRKAVFYTVLLTTFMLSALVTLHARFRVIPLEKFHNDWAETDATSWFFGWKELASCVKAYPKTAFILSPSHQLSAELAYYLDGKPPAHVDLDVTRFSQWNYWPSPVKNGEYCIYISLEGEALDFYKAYIPVPEKMDFVTVHRGRFPFKTYRIVYGKCSLH